MKKFIYKSLLAAFTVLTLGCVDLEEKPLGRLSPDGFFASTANVEAIILGAYANIQAEQLYGRRLVSSLLLRSDMSEIANKADGNRVQINDFNIAATNGDVATIWQYCYRVVRSANLAIEGAEILTGKADEKVLNQLKAEAMFLRAWTYYHLVQLFGEVPYLTKAEADPLSPKASVETIYAAILADLEYAKQVLPDKRPTGGANGSRTRPTKGAAASYLASVHMTLGNWQNAYNEAKYVIDNRTTFGYALVANFQDLWRSNLQNGMTEHIFAVDFKRTLGRDRMAAMTTFNIVAGSPNGGTISGFSVNVPTQAVVDTWNNLDYRKWVSFDTTAIATNSTVPPGTIVHMKYDTYAPRPHIAKYARFSGSTAADKSFTDHNYVCMRYAEILLIAAEALNEVNGGPNAEAEGYVNQVRARARAAAGTPRAVPANVTPGLTKAAFLDLVLEERRLELAFEFKRWYDIKRRDLLVKAFTGPGSLEPHPNVDPSRDYLFPIPQREIDLNKNLLPQNPGY